MDIGKKIKELREEKSFSQKHLAASIGMKQNTISQFESGKAYPSLESLVSIARFFDVTTDYLLGLEDIFGNKIHMDITENNSHIDKDKNKLISIYSKLTIKNKSLCCTYTKGLLDSQE